MKILNERWKEIKQRAKIGSDNTLAIHLSSCPSLPLSSLSPLNQAESAFETGIAFPMDVPSMLEYAIFVCLKLTTHDYIIMIM